MVVMLTAAKKYLATNNNTDNKKRCKRTKADKNKKQGPNLLSFFTHQQVVGQSNGAKYKVRDSKTWNDNTCRYCDCPNYCFKQHWHKHKAKDCTVRQCWLKEREKETIANMAKMDTEQSEGQLGGTESQLVGKTGTQEADVTALSSEDSQQPHCI